MYYIYTYYPYGVLALVVDIPKNKNARGTTNDLRNLILGIVCLFC